MLNYTLTSSSENSIYFNAQPVNRDMLKQAEGKSAPRHLGNKMSFFSTMQPGSVCSIETVLDHILICVPRSLEFEHL